MTLGIAKKNEQELADWLSTEAGFLAGLGSVEGEPLILETYQTSFLQNRSRFRWVVKSRQVGYGHSFAPGDFRGHYFAGERLTEAVARAQALEAVRARHPDEAKNLAELALRFCLAHPAVDTVIPGMRRIEHLRANLAAADGRPLSPELMEQLREHAWDKNWYA